MINLPTSELDYPEIQNLSHYPQFRVTGTYLIIQVVDLFLIWGDLPLMTGTAFLLFTNLAQAAKIFNLLSRKQVIQGIIADADQVLTGVKSAEAKEIVKRFVFYYKLCWITLSHICTPSLSFALTD